MIVLGRPCDVLAADPRAALMKWSELTGEEQARFTARYPDDDALSAGVLRFLQRARGRTPPGRQGPA